MNIVVEEYFRNMNIVVEEYFKNMNIVRISGNSKHFMNNMFVFWDNLYEITQNHHVEKTAFLSYSIFVECSSK